MQHLTLFQLKRILFTTIIEYHVTKPTGNRVKTKYNFNLFLLDLYIFSTVLNTVQFAPIESKLSFRLRVGP